MNVPEYVTAEEVRRICKALKIRDWTRLKKPDVLPKEARAILSALGLRGIGVSADDFRQGLEVELEHGTRYPDANVTNNHPLLTGRIVLAHLKESLDYYKRLEIAELEGDVLKATVAGSAAKLATLQRKLARARLVLAKAEAKQLS